MVIPAVLTIAPTGRPPITTSVPDFPHLLLVAHTYFTTSSIRYLITLVMEADPHQHQGHHTHAHSPVATAASPVLVLLRDTPAAA